MKDKGALKMNSTISLGLAIFASVLVCGCSTTVESPYRDPTAVRGSTTDFSSYDLQQCAVAIVDSMLANPNLDQRLKDQFPIDRPVVSVMPVENKTYRILDLRPMTDTIQSRLVNSGKFDFIERDAENLMISELVHDAESPLVADGANPGFKAQVAANYLLTGALVEIREGDGRTRESYYKLTMKLLNKHTGRVDWSGEKELRKVGRRAKMGM